MTTISQVVTALAAVLDDITGVDVVDTTGYDAAITTRDVALIIPPFDQASMYGFMTHEQSGDPNWQTHVIRCEFWCKVTGSIATAATRARTVEAAIVSTLLVDQTLGGVITAIASTEDGETISSVVRTRVDDVIYRDVPFYRVIAEIPVLILN
jgi:hypothetical protein